MQHSLVLDIGLPIALVIIMLGLGLSLRVEDFTRSLARPRPVIVGLACQILILPALCFLLVLLADLPPAIAVGMMLLAASPGGPSAAIFTHLARGDAALSLIQVAVSSVVALVSLPLIANTSLPVFYGEADTVRLEVDQVLQIFVIAIVPAVIGMFIGRGFPDLARRLEQPVKMLASLFLIAVVLTALVGQWELLLVWGPVVGLVVFVFNVLSLLVGYAVPRMMLVKRRQAVALALSTGIHNAALVIAIAMNEKMLDNPEMALPPAAYALFSYVVCAAFAWAMKGPAETI